MKVPRRISEILRRKQLFIDGKRDVLQRDILRLQSRLLDEIIAEILPFLDVKDGVILDTVKNYRLLSDLDKVYNNFARFVVEGVGAKIISSTSTLAKINQDYFTISLSGDLPKRFDRVIASSKLKIDLRLGVEGGKMVRGGFLESFLKDPSLSTQVKNYISKSITGQMDTKEFITGLRQMINGDGGPGGLEKQYNRFAFDLYQQYDAAYGLSLAEEFDMRFFIYQGGLIGDSRDFCAAHNNKVWTRDESETWATWTPADGEYPEGYEIKAKDLTATPSYLGYVGYQPLIDRGGYNCRHSIGWISDTLAFDLRPELKKIYQTIDK